MKRFIVPFFVFLIVSVPIVSAQEKGFIEGITDFIGITMSNILFVFKSYIVNPLVDFYLRYIAHDTSGLERFHENIEKETALQSAYNQQYRNPECCTPAECLIDKTKVCVTVCEECSKVIDDINEHYD